MCFAWLYDAAAMRKTLYSHVTTIEICSLIS